MQCYTVTYSNKKKILQQTSHSVVLATLMGSMRSVSRAIDVIKKKKKKNDTLRWAFLGKGVDLTARVKAAHPNRGGRITLTMFIPLYI